MSTDLEVQQPLLVPHAEGDERGENEIDAHEEQQPDALQHTRVEVNAAHPGWCRRGRRGRGGLVVWQRSGGEDLGKIDNVKANNRVQLRVDAGEGSSHLLGMGRACCMPRVRGAKRMGAWTRHEGVAPHQKRDDNGGDQVDEDEQRVAVRQPQMSRRERLQLSERRSAARSRCGRGLISQCGQAVPRQQRRRQRKLFVSRAGK